MVRRMTDLRKDIKAGPVMKALMIEGESLQDILHQWKRLTTDEKNDLLEAGLAEGVTVLA